MGGDQGPLVTIPSAIMAVQSMPELTLILCGNEKIIIDELIKNKIYPHSQLIIHPTTEVVEMYDKPSFAMRSKKTLLCVKR